MPGAKSEKKKQNFSSFKHGLSGTAQSDFPTMTKIERINVETFEIFRFLFILLCNNLD
jgi:hypothetical protein